MNYVAHLSEEPVPSPVCSNKDNKISSYSACLTKEPVSRSTGVAGTCTVAHLSEEPVPSPVCQSKDNKILRYLACLTKEPVSRSTGVAGTQ